MAPFDKKDRTRVSNCADLTPPAVFDFPNPELPPTFHHTDRFTNQSRAEVKFPWEKLTGDPLIYASMGTVQNGAEHVFPTIAEACSTGCHGTLLGENVTRASVRCPGTVSRWSCATGLLERAALCITHAGLNTALNRSRR